MMKYKMKKAAKTIGVMLLTAGIALSSAGCTKKSETAAISADETSTKTVIEDASGISSDSENADNTSSVISTEEGNTVKTSDSDSYTERDMSGEWDESEAVLVEMNGTSASVSGAQAGALSVQDGLITILKEGTYVFTGDFNGQIVAQADEAEKIQIVLNGVNIYTEESASILVKTADKVFITLAGGTQNTVKTGDTFITDADGEPDAAIFSKEDITINGDGSLTVETGYQDGIVSKDDLKICGGTINVIASDDAIRGKDSVRISGGTLTLTSDEGHGIKSTNEEEAGYILIDGGEISITSAKDGIHAYGDVTVNGGEIIINTGDDGIHAGGTLTINDGTVNVENSYEGIEGASIIINGGDVSVLSSDDGLNAAGGTDTASGYQQDAFMWASSSDSVIEINGGSVSVTANGDGIDSNGSLYISGGTIYVNGPWTGGNGSLDIGDMGCEAVISGGTIITAGTSDMAIGFSQNSSQPSMLVGLNGTYDAGTNVELKDSDGNTVISYSPAVPFSCVLLSSEDMKTGETYELYISGQLYAEIQMTSSSVSYNIQGFGGMGGQMPGGNQGFGAPSGGQGFGGGPGGRH